MMGGDTTVDVVQLDRSETERSLWDRQMPVWSMEVIYSGSNQDCDFGTRKYGKQGKVFILTKPEVIAEI